MNRAAAKFDPGELKTLLGRFIQDFEIHLNTGTVPAEIALPQSWRQLIARQEQDKSLDLLPEWYELRSELPDVVRFLESALRGYAILLQQGRASLLYIYSDGGKLRFYCGNSPSAFSKLRNGFSWEKFPPKLRFFYERLHNGWYFLASRSMGILKLEDLRPLSEDEWDFEDGDEDRLPFHLQDVLEVFPNGAGDYLCIDLRSRSQDKNALVFWHEEPGNPEMGQDFFSVMNAWIQIFVERADAT